MIMVRALERNLTIADFEILTVGMIIDYIITYDNLNSSNENEDKESVVNANQESFNNF